MSKNVGRVSNATLAVYSWKFINLINDNQTISDQLRMVTRTRNIKQKRRLSERSFNVRGVTEDTKKEQLVRDVNHYGRDVYALQKTKIENTGVKRVNGSMVTTFDSKSKHYSNGFVVPK